MQQRVLIVGAGIGGLTLAAALGKRGIEPQVLEIRNEEHPVTGIGLSMPANALRALRTIGVLDDCLQAGYQFTGYTFCNERGETIVELPAVDRFDGTPGYMGISRLRFSEILTAAAKGAGATIRRGRSISELEQDAESVLVTLNDGSNEEYDLVVGFEGIGSPLRRTLMGAECDPIYMGHACWRVKSERPDFVTGMVAYLGVPYTKAGVVPIDEETLYLFHITTEPGNPRQDLARFRELLYERLRGYSGPIGHIRETLPDSKDIAYSPLEEVVLPARWYRGRVVIAGDAAHAMPPVMSQGGSMALEDGVVLADVVASAVSVPQALEAFMQRRYERCKFVQDRSREMLKREMDPDPVAMDERMRNLPETLPRGMGEVNSYLDHPV